MVFLAKSVPSPSLSESVEPSDIQFPVSASPLGRPEAHSVSVEPTRFT
jgi:hypothetical protein